MRHKQKGSGPVIGRRCVCERLRPLSFPILLLPLCRMIVCPVCFRFSHLSLSVCLPLLFPSLSLCLLSLTEVSQPAPVTAVCLVSLSLAHVALRGSSEQTTHTHARQRCTTTQQQQRGGGDNSRRNNHQSEEQ